MYVKMVPWEASCHNVLIICLQQQQQQQFTPAVAAASGGTASNNTRSNSSSSSENLSTTNLYIRGLPSNFTDDDLINICQQ